MLRVVMGSLFNMAFPLPSVNAQGAVSSVTSIASEATSNIQGATTGALSGVKSKAPKLPTVPTKIDLKTGKGVPGGFSAANVKIPSVETSKYAAALSNVTSQASTVSKLLASSPGAAGVSLLKPVMGKLDGMKASYTKKMADIKKSAVDFTKPNSIPKLPSVSQIDVPKVEIPPIPSMPQAPALPSVSAPSVPSFKV